MRWQWKSYIFSDTISLLYVHWKYIYTKLWNLARIYVGPYSSCQEINQGSVIHFSIFLYFAGGGFSFQGLLIDCVLVIII